MNGMTPEVIAITAVGGSLGALMVGLGALILAVFQTMNRRLDSLEQRFLAFEQRVDQRFLAFEQRVDQRFTAFEERFSVLEQRQARLEGIMETIRDALRVSPSTS